MKVDKDTGGFEILRNQYFYLKQATGSYGCSLYQSIYMLGSVCMCVYM